MPANNSKAHALNTRWPGRLAMLFSPDSWRSPKSLPFALDNGRFVVWSRGAEWSEADYYSLLDKAQDAGDPLWVAVPDVVADADATFREWDVWASVLRDRGLRLALVVQDGMTPDSVRRNTDPDVLFVGGTTEWKRRTLWEWCHTFPRVHVGRINTEKWLWNAHKCGAESCDGTGWFRGDKRQLLGLMRYLRKSSDGVGVDQLELEFGTCSE